MDGGWMPLPTRPQRYCDPASLVLVLVVLVLFLLRFAPSHFFFFFCFYHSDVSLKTGHLSKRRRNYIRERNQQKPKITIDDSYWTSW